MHVLCAVGQRGGPQLVRRVVEMLFAGSELLLLHVVDTGPRHDLKHLIGSLRHGPAGASERESELHAAEESAGKAALAETQEAAQAAGFSARTSLAWGRPEEIILQLAESENVSLIGRVEKVAHRVSTVGSQDWTKVVGTYPGGLFILPDSVP